MCEWAAWLTLRRRGPQSRQLCSLVAYDEAWLRSPQFVVGVALWALGFAINVHSDGVLRDLRRGRKPGGPRYSIPRGGAFEWVRRAAAPWRAGSHRRAGRR